MLVRMRYSHALRLVPSRNWWKERVRLRVRLLHQVLGVGRVARHAQRGRVHLVEVAEGVPLEARVALGGRLVSAWLRLSSVPATGPTSSDCVASPNADPLESENSRPIPLRPPPESVGLGRGQHRPVQVGGLREAAGKGQNPCGGSLSMTSVPVATTRPGLLIPGRAGTSGCTGPLRIVPRLPSRGRPARPRRPP